MLTVKPVSLLFYTHTLTQIPTIKLSFDSPIPKNNTPTSCFFVAILQQRIQ